MVISLVCAADGRGRVPWVVIKHSSRRREVYIAYTRGPSRQFTINFGTSSEIKLDENLPALVTASVQASNLHLTYNAIVYYSHAGEAVKRKVLGG